MKFVVTGDTHGQVMSRLMSLDHEQYPVNDTAVIILGDVGVNFYLNKTDKKNKKIINNSGYIIYCVRGNHEERPENIKGMEQWYDEIIEGTVWREAAYPNIRYLMDGHAYLFNGHPTLVIGGAYSVDKWYRLSHMPKDAEWTGWFKDEQLTPEEMQDISARFAGKHFHFILSHTCPESWQPYDLFLPGLDQSTVDKSMEVWLEQFKETVTWNAWLFGHFHNDRLVRPGVEMFFKDIEDLDTIWERWTSSKELDWWLVKDPNYYVEEEN